MGTETELALGVCIDRWRLTCPRNHRGRNLQPREDHWMCRSCRDSSWGSVFRHETVEDQKTGLPVAPSDVKITGPESVEIRKLPTTDD